MPPAHQETAAESSVVDRWFRALDQRPIYLGVRKWLVQVTGVYADADNVWIQIADGMHAGGSIVLRVTSTTTIDEAVHMLTECRQRSERPYPLVFTAAVSPIREPQRVPATK
jgi:hypothetical protein